MQPHEKRCAPCEYYEDGKYFDYCEGETMQPLGVYAWITRKGCASWHARMEK